MAGADGRSPDRLGTLAHRFTGDQTTVIELPTGGFTVNNLRGYYNATKNLSIVAGINNLFDRSYLEHLSVRYAGSPPTPANPAGFPFVAVYSMGFTPYGGGLTGRIECE